jgi:pyruvate dehydrogenase (quinone)
MARTVAEFTIDRLSEWGIKRIYGYPGDGINGLMGALRIADEKIEFIQVRHEETAAFMATSLMRLAFVWQHPGLGLSIY